jgi:threonine dehydratase
MKAHSPKTRIVAIQATGAPAMIESWRTGKVIEHDKVDTICDGIAVRVPIPEAVDDMKGLVDDALLISDKATIRAMRLLHEHIGLVTEPSGATGIAALIENQDLFKGQNVGTVICGGNVTPEQMKHWLS